MNRGTYVFDDVTTLINYLLFLNREITPLRLQKSLYFMYAYYGATYGQMNDAREEASVYEGGFSYPEELFPANFEAWKFGPVLNDVYVKFRDKSEYVATDWVPKNNFFADVKEFLDDLFTQLNSVGDFGLVERSHMDDSWSKEYKEGISHIAMNNQTIIQEYVTKYV